MIFSRLDPFFSRLDLIFPRLVPVKIFPFDLIFSRLRNSVCSVYSMQKLQYWENSIVKNI